MPHLTPVSWKKFEKFLIEVGCRLERERGDHRIYWRSGLSRPIVIPKDSALPIFVIRNNIRVLNISPDEYLEILDHT